MNTEDFQSSDNVRDTDINLPVEPSEAPQGGVDAVGSVGGGHNDNVGSLLHTVHKGEELGDDTSLDLEGGRG